ncbi:MAG: hypothetical protein AB1846_06025 [Chloroflexota bacterium]
MDKEVEYYHYRSVLQEMLEGQGFSSLPENSQGLGRASFFERGPLRISWFYDLRDQMLILTAQDESNKDKKARLWKSFTSSDHLAELETILRRWLDDQAGPALPPSPKKKPSTMPDWLAAVSDDEA